MIAQIYRDAYNEIMQDMNDKLFELKDLYDSAITYDCGRIIKKANALEYFTGGNFRLEPTDDEYRLTIMYERDDDYGYDKVIMLDDEFFDDFTAFYVKVKNYIEEQNSKAYAEYQEFQNRRKAQSEANDYELYLKLKEKYEQK